MCNARCSKLNRTDRKCAAEAPLQTNRMSKVGDPVHSLPPHSQVDGEEQRPTRTDRNVQRRRVHKHLHDAGNDERGEQRKKHPAHSGDVIARLEGEEHQRGDDDRGNANSNENHLRGGSKHTEGADYTLDVCGFILAYISWWSRRASRSNSQSSAADSRVREGPMQH